MKPFFIFLTVVAVIASGCKNYDDRFDDLNGQIATLTTQVQALQGVATQVSALNTEIGNIRSSIQGDIQTAVAGVSTTLGTNLQSAQTALNGEIAKLQTALNDAAENSLSQDDIDKLKSELQTTLAAAQKTALDTALASLQAKLTELETALGTAASGALSQADLDKLKEEIETQLAQVKEDLEESLGEGGFHSGEVTINSSGSWEFTKRQLSDKTEFSGNFTINTGSLTDAEVDELIAWVAEITLIHGNLKITHTGKEKVIKFAKLRSVTDLDDSQLHAHYPELTSAGVITLDGNIETVKLPQLKTVKHFDGDRDDDDEDIADEHHLQLKKATELTLTALASYKADLTIDLGGAEATLDLSALKTLDSNGDEKDGEVDLTIIGPDEASLPELITLNKLHVQDVREVSAPKVKGADLQIGEDVDEVDVGTAEGAHINQLTIPLDSDIKTLKIGGNPISKDGGSRGGDAIAGKSTVLKLNGSEVETIHVYGAFDVRLENLEEIEEIITARIIPRFVLIGSDYKGGLILDHQGGDRGVLALENNLRLETLTADNLNPLKNLFITGNHDLEKISFQSLEKAAEQDIGDQSNERRWFTGDGVRIGAQRFRDRDYMVEDRNNLVATKIEAEVKEDGKVKRKGKIVDESGLSDLKEFLGHENMKRAVVYYDGAEEFSATDDANQDPVELTATRADRDYLLLIRKGVANRTTPSSAAKRVFLVDTGNDSFSTDGTENLRIGVGGGEFSSYYRDIDLAGGGSVNNFVNTINDAKVKKFFETNNVIVHAEAGGHPKGSLTFKTDGALNRDAGDSNTANDPVGSLKLTIGNVRTGVYSHEVILQVVDDDNPLKADVAFSATEKKAVTYLDANVATNNATNRGYADLEDLAKILIRAFHTFVNDEDQAFVDPPRAIEAVNFVPFGISSLHNVSIEGEERANTVIVGVYDAQKIPEKAINVKVENNIKLTSAPDAENVAFFKVGESFESSIGLTQKNIKNDPNTIQITLTSKVAGKDESTIGDPIDEPSEDTDTPQDGNDDVDFVLPDSDFEATAGAYVYAGTTTSGASRELPIGDGNPRKSSLPKKGQPEKKTTDRGGDDLSRLKWLE